MILIRGTGACGSVDLNADGGFAVDLNQKCRIRCDFELSGVNSHMDPIVLRDVDCYLDSASHRSFISVQGWDRWSQNGKWMPNVAQLRISGDVMAVRDPKLGHLDELSVTAAFAGHGCDELRIPFGLAISGSAPGLHVRLGRDVMKKFIAVHDDGHTHVFPLASPNTRIWGPLI
jgi:hypothetical protein